MRKLLIRKNISAKKTKAIWQSKSRQGEQLWLIQTVSAWLSVLY